MRCRKHGMSEAESAEPEILGTLVLVPLVGRSGPWRHIYSPASNLATTASTAFPSVDVRSHFRSSPRALGPASLPPCSSCTSAILV